MQLNHYLNFQGETEAAFNFYKSVFGGEFSHIQRYGDMPEEEDVKFTEQEKKHILHVSLPINEFTVLMASDINEAYCLPNAPPFNKGNNHYITINLDHHEIDQASYLFNALSVNGEIEMPLEKTFWGALYGAFTDQFGIKWMINCALPQS